MHECILTAALDPLHRQEFGTFHAFMRHHNNHSIHKLKANNKFFGYVPVNIPVIYYKYALRDNKNLYKAEFLLVQSKKRDEIEGPYSHDKYYISIYKQFSMHTIMGGSMHHKSMLICACKSAVVTHIVFEFYNSNNVQHEWYHENTILEL